MLPAGGSPYREKTVSLPPVFLFSHQNRLRRADFGDSFPSGEAIAASPLNDNLFYPKFCLLTSGEKKLDTAVKFWYNI